MMSALRAGHLRLERTLLYSQKRLGVQSVSPSHWAQEHPWNNIGGLRNPASSVEEVPGWMEVGAQVADILHRTVERNQPKFEKLLSELGTETELAPEVVQEARE